MELDKTMENETPNETINQAIAEFMGLCWHEIDRPQYGDSSNCNKCEKFTHFRFQHGEILIEQNPDYCSPDSPRRLLDEVVAKVVEKIGAVQFSNFIADLRRPHPVDRYEFADCIIRATPEQIARAIYAVIKEAAI